MARLPRNVVADQPVHVIQRGNNRQPVFFTSGDYRHYTNALRIAVDQTACLVHAYVLMTNHVHLLITPSTPSSLSHLMQSVGCRYVRYVNARYDRTGTLWEGRFRSAVIDSERYMLACMRYIELNPVRAGIVRQPGDYAWSSFFRNAHGDGDPIVTPHPLYLALADDPAARQAAYRNLLRESEQIDSDALSSLRSGTEKGVPIGDDRFRERIAAMLDRRVAKFSHGGPRRGDPFRNLSSTLTP